MKGTLFMNQDAIQMRLCVPTTSNALTIIIKHQLPQNEVSNETHDESGHTREGMVVTRIQEGHTWSEGKSGYNIKHCFTANRTSGWLYLLSITQQLEHSLWGPCSNWPYDALKVNVRSTGRHVIYDHWVRDQYEALPTAKVIFIKGLPGMRSFKAMNYTYDEAEELVKLSQVTRGSSNPALSCGDGLIKRENKQC